MTALLCRILGHRFSGTPNLGEHGLRVCQRCGKTRGKPMRTVNAGASHDR